MAQQNSLQDLPRQISESFQSMIPSPVRKMFGAADEATNKLTKKVDPTWHDKAVDEANESFRKSAEKKVAALGDKKLGQKKKAAAKSKSKGKASQKRSY